MSPEIQELHTEVLRRQSALRQEQELEAEVAPPYEPPPVGELVPVGDRPGSAPGPAVGRLYPSGCAATVLSAPVGNVVLTAAHCLRFGVDGTLDGAAASPERLRFVPGADEGKAPFGVWRVADIVTSVPLEGPLDLETLHEHDVAFLIMEPGEDGADIESVTGDSCPRST